MRVPNDDRRVATPRFTSCLIAEFLSDSYSLARTGKSNALFTGQVLVLSTQRSISCPSAI